MTLFGWSSPPVLPVWMLCHLWGQRSLCVAGTLALQVAASFLVESPLPPPGRHTSYHFCGLEHRPGPQPGALTSPQASLSHRPSPLDPSLCRQPPACAHCGLSLITWACPRHHLVLVFEGLVGRRQGDIYGGDQKAFSHPLKAPPATS